MTINPKSISMSQLYGYTNEVTNEFKDGLISKFFSDFISSDQNKTVWFVFDGPIDSIWIENLNSVLDDTMTLCLSNGKRIKLSWNMRMIFEVEDVQQTSPATISRVGMIFVDERNVDVNAIMAQQLLAMA